MPQIVMLIFLFCILSSRRSLRQCWVATFRQMTSTLWQAPVIRKQLFMKLCIDNSGELTCSDMSVRNVFLYTNKILSLDVILKFCWPHRWGVAILFCISAFRMCHRVCVIMCSCSVRLGAIGKYIYIYIRNWKLVIGGLNLREKKKETHSLN